MLDPQLRMLIIERSVAESDGKPEKCWIQKKSICMKEPTLPAKFLFNVIEEHLGHQLLNTYNFRQGIKSNMAQAAKRRNYLMS